MSVGGLGKAGGDAFGSYFDPKSQKRALSETMGSFFDMGFSFNQQMIDEEIARDQQAQQQRIAAQYQAMAEAKAKEQLDLRNQLYQRTATLDHEIKRTSAKLGEFSRPSATSIQQDYGRIRDGYMGDFMDIVERTSSTATADSISRGLGSSTYNSDRQADIIEKSMDKVAELDSGAWTEAINRAKSYSGALNYGRTEMLDETKGVYSAAFDAEKAMLDGTGAQMMQQSYNNQSDATDRAADQLSDSQETFGNSVGRFGEQIAPNMAFAFGDESKGYNSMASDREKEIAFYRANSKVKYTKPEEVS